MVEEMKNKINARASKVKRKKKLVKFTKLALLLFLFILLVLYVVVSIVYNGGNFSITLDRNLYLKRGIIIYDNPEYKEFRTELYAQTLEFIDNIAGKWLPDDLDNHSGGSHNGNNYVAYTFFVENLGTNVTDYWSEIVIENVIKNVDEAIRIRVYKNGEYVTYAKASANGSPEKDTIAFRSDTLIALNHVEGFAPGDKDKYTVVIWLEGTDPECTDSILGGEIKVYMDFNSEIIEK